MSLLDRALGTRSAVIDRATTSVDDELEDEGVEQDAAPAELAVRPPAGLGSWSYVRDLNALQSAVRNNALDLNDKIQRFCDQYKMRDAIKALDGASTPGNDNTGRMYPGIRNGSFVVRSSLGTGYDYFAYTQKLNALLPKVQSGAMSLEQARKRAALPFQLAAPFGGDQRAMEIASRADNSSVLVVFGSAYSGRYAKQQGRIGFSASSEQRPDGFQQFKHGRDQLDSLVVLDNANQVAALDQTTPQKGYETLLRTFRYLGELGGGFPLSSLLESIGIRLPIIQAPMAGGPDTPALAAAVNEAGGLGSLGCGYLSAEQIEAIAADMRQRTARPFALNLFIRDAVPNDTAAAARVLPIVSQFRRELGLSPDPGPARPAPSFAAQLAAVIRVRPRVFSFTFGLPIAEQVAALRASSILVVGTATSLDEAEALAALSVDAVCAQGAEAGGHRGTFAGRVDESLVGTLALTRQIVARVPLPVIAAGGIMDGAGIRAALALGAAAVQLGTAFMLCPEAGTHPAHRAALQSPAARRTVVTRAFSGRAARGIANRMTDAFDDVSAAPFPQQQEWTAELRAKAAADGRTDLMQLWAGQAASLIRERPAAELMATLAAEAGF